MVSWAAVRKPVGLSLIIVLCLAVFASPQSGRSLMKGFVVDETGVRPIRGATVDLQGDSENPRLRSTRLTTTTDDEGHYSFKDVPYGDYILSVAAPGRRTYRIDIYILSDATTELHVRLRNAE